MSAPETNIEKQKRRHWPVLIFIVLAVAIAALAFLGVLGSDEVDNSAPAAATSN